MLYNSSNKDLDSKAVSSKISINLHFLCFRLVYLKGPHAHFSPFAIFFQMRIEIENDQIIWSGWACAKILGLGNGMGIFVQHSEHIQNNSKHIQYSKYLHKMAQNMIAQGWRQWVSEYRQQREHLADLHHMISQLRGCWHCWKQVCYCNWNFLLVVKEADVTVVCLFVAIAKTDCKETNFYRRRFSYTQGKVTRKPILIEIWFLMPCRFLRCFVS